MAISKDIENEFMAVFRYHRIREARVMQTEKGIQLRIVTESYVDKEARKAGARAVVTESVITNADFAMRPFYELLKTQFPVFAGGEDDMDDAWKDGASGAPECVTQTMDGRLIDRRKESVKPDEKEK